MSQQAQDDYYKDEVALALDYASAVNAEIKDLLRRAPTEEGHCLSANAGSPECHVRGDDCVRLVLPERYARTRRPDVATGGNSGAVR
jgi:hypothetical protein